MCYILGHTLNPLRPIPPIPVSPDHDCVATATYAFIVSNCADYGRSSQISVTILSPMEDLEALGKSSHIHVSGSTYQIRDAQKTPCQPYRYSSTPPLLSEHTRNRQVSPRIFAWSTMCSNREADRTNLDQGVWVPYHEDVAKKQPDEVALQNRLLFEVLNDSSAAAAQHQ